MSLTSTVANSPAISLKFRNLAENMQKDINHRFGNRQENTPKRRREAASQRIEGRKLQRAQQALLALAEAHERGCCPAILADIHHKSEVIDMVRTHCGSNGYYDIHDTHKFCDNSDKAAALRQLADSLQSDDDRNEKQQQERQREIRDMENKAVLSCIDGFFPTPKSVTSIMLDRLSVVAPGIDDKEALILEPSAGAGNLACDIQQRFPRSEVWCCEVVHSLCDILEMKGLKFYRGDFLQQEPSPVFDAVLMNPPFENSKAIDHIRHAYEFVKPDCVLIAIGPNSLSFRTDRKHQEFRDWIYEKWGSLEMLPPDSFKGNDALRATGVCASLVTIIKR